MSTKIYVDGVGLRSLGLRLPEVNVSALPRYAEVGPMMPRGEIVKLIESRTPRREIFGDDWIKDQNGIGACAGYAAASLVERCRFMSGHSHEELSGDGIYAAVNGGVDRGSTLEANMIWIGKNGVPPASEVPLHEYKKSQIPNRAYEEGARFRGFEGYFLQTELELASAIVNDYFCAVAVHAGRGGRSPDGMIDWRNGVGNHSVCVDDVRFRDSRFEFEIANSWGLRWGVKGRGFVAWSTHLSEPIRHHKFYAFRAVRPDSQGDNPPYPRE